MLDRRGVITGGSGRPIDEEILARKAQLRALRAEFAEAEQKASAAAERCEQLIRETRRADEELAGLDRRIHELTVDRVEAEGDLELHRQNLIRTRDRAMAVEAELKSVQTEDEVLRGRLREIDGELSALESLIAATEEERKRCQQTLEDCEERMVAGRARLEAQKVEEAELRQRREAGQERLQEVRVALEELEARRVGLQRQLERDRSELWSTRERLDAPDFELEEAREALGRAQQRVALLVLEEQEASSWLRAADKRLQALAKELDAVREQRGHDEVRLKERQLECQALLESARERLDAGSDALLGAAAEGREVAEEALDDELQKVRNSLRRLGTVNMGAVYELEEIEGRLAELTGQRDDLERSINDLRGTIARLNRLSRDRFKETFDAVNEIFKKTFPSMFRGGRAWLALSDEQNLLETGVEIFVRPPGKRVGNLSLLSGGEKALTAVSLIFSLFLYKPSPFCVLDEVEAPLDDANIGRFARMVREMSDRSQFVLITHNKRTMEACDILYGVTMGEPGVSKVVSVDLPS